MKKARVSRYNSMKKARHRILQHCMAKGFSWLTWFRGLKKIVAKKNREIITWLRKAALRWCWSCLRRCVTRLVKVRLKRLNSLHRWRDGFTIRKPQRDSTSTTRSERCMHRRSQEIKPSGRSVCWCLWMSDMSAITQSDDLPHGTPNQTAQGCRGLLIWIYINLYIYIYRYDYIYMCDYIIYIYILICI